MEAITFLPRCRIATPRLHAPSGQPPVTGLGDAVALTRRADAVRWGPGRSCSPYTPNQLPWPKRTHSGAA